MLVYLIRHAHAVDAGEDPERPLSDRGTAQVRSIAAFLKQTKEFQPEEFWHSPLVRSQETAALLAKRLHLDVSVTLMPDLEPEDDPRAIARRIKAATVPIAIVGHEPHLSSLASLLIAGKPEPAKFVMKKAAVLALEGIGDHWMVRWHIHPDLVA
ncbi:phosphohistidine phosphatase SixA [Horticoccus sp. 23ND18S-11]|uniref:phosphohistidine phosphatase SixA n=1 Tax=Horticoccus sp. 23ND18S-11 TaxID=3391832 RepID=UPI0039C9F5F9